MEDDGRDLRDRMPRRQLVYPFLELEFQDADDERGQELAEVTTVI